MRFNGIFAGISWHFIVIQWDMNGIYYLDGSFSVTELGIFFRDFWDDTLW